MQRSDAPPDSDHELRISTPVAVPSDEVAAAKEVIRTLTFDAGTGSVTEA